MHDFVSFDRNSFADLRARAGIEYVLQTLTDDGRCGYPRKELIKSESSSTFATKRLILTYLVGLDCAEGNLASHLAELCKAFHFCPDIEIEKAVSLVINLTCKAIPDRFGFNISRM